MKLMWQRLASNLKSQFKLNGFSDISFYNFKKMLEAGGISFSGGGFKAVLTGKFRKCDADIYAYRDRAAFVMKRMSNFFVLSFNKKPAYGVMRSWTKNDIVCVINYYHRKSFDAQKDLIDMDYMVGIMNEEVDDEFMSIVKDTVQFNGLPIYKVLDVIRPETKLPDHPAVQVVIVKRDEGSCGTPNCFERFDRSDVKSQLSFLDRKGVLEVAMLDDIRGKKCTVSPLLVGLASIYKAKVGLEETCKMLSELSKGTSLQLPPNFLGLFKQRPFLPKREWDARFHEISKQVINLFRKLLFVRVKKAWSEGLEFTNLNVYEKVLVNGNVRLEIEPKKS